MKIAIVGAGGVGGFLAAMLARAGEEVYLVARGRQLDAVKHNGVCVELQGETLCARPEKVSDNPGEFAEIVDIVLFCTKGYDLDDAARSVRPIVAPGTLLVPLGNGVGNAERIRQHYPHNLVANGAIYIVSYIKAPGVIAVKGKGAYVVVGMDGEVSPIVQKLAETFKRAGIKAKVSGDITTEVWKKFLLISAMATLTSCYDEPMGAVLEKHSKELDAALHEIFLVGKAEGAKLDENDINRTIEQIKKVPYDSPTSMWLDIKSGKKSELEELGGYVVKKGAEHDIPVPIMKKCYENLKTR